MKLQSELLTIDEVPGLFIDALICDEAGALLFISIWGHDTPLKEFVARLSLPSSQGGMTTFTVVSPTLGSRLVSAGNIDKLEQLTGRTSETTVFGALSQLWLYDGLLTKPDYANARALMPFFSGKDQANIDQRVWRQVKTLCCLPLLDHWEIIIMQELHKSQLISEITGFGLNCILLHLDREIIETAIVSLVQQGVLSLEQGKHNAPMDRVADVQ